MALCSNCGREIGSKRKVLIVDMNPETLPVLTCFSG